MTSSVVILGAFEKMSVKALPPGPRRSAPGGNGKSTAGKTPGRAAAETTVVVALRLKSYGARTCPIEPLIPHDACRATHPLVVCLG